MFRDIEVFLRRSQRSVQNIDRLQKLRVLYESSEVELMAGKIVTILVKI